MESDQGWAVPLERKQDGRKVYYRYSDSDFSISNEPLNESEINQIEAAVSVLSRFAGAPQFEWVQELIPLLKDRLGLKSTEEEVISVESNIDLKGLDHLSDLYEAIINKQVLQVSYQDFKTDTPYEITFHPYYLKQYNNRWFVFGRNEELGIETWNMALDRIESMEPTRAAYKKSDTDWGEYFFDIVGVTKKPDTNMEKVELLFSGSSAPYVQTKPLHPTQKTEKRGDELLVTIEVIPNYELESLILSYGENVTVISPDSLKYRIKERIKKMNV
jgi:predicted DNA-binding transcriptional regulator YafY